MPPSPIVLAFQSTWFIIALNHPYIQLTIGNINIPFCHINSSSSLPYNSPSLFIYLLIYIFIY